MPRYDKDMKKLFLNRFIFLLFVFFLPLLQLNTLAQSCNGYPTGNVFPGNIMNYSPACAPVSVASWYVVYSRVDDGGVPTNIAFEFIWGDGVSEIIPYSSGTITYTAASKKYEIYKNHTYPSTTTVCVYNPIVYLRVNGTRCTSTLQTQPVYMWDKDNAGSGVLLLQEQSTSVALYQICEGVNNTLTFIDNSTFNCNISASPDNPNQQTRWVQFQYGTSNNGTYTAIPRIPNVWVGATQVTNASGNLVAGVLNGTVVSIPNPAIGSGKKTLGVVIDGASTIGKAGTVFEITLRNWNFCNQYDDGVLPAPGVNGDNPPVIITAIIQVIQSPIAPTASNLTVCNNGNTQLSASPHNAGTLKWYKNAALGIGNLVGTGTTFDPSVSSPQNTSPINKTTAGNYNYWVTETLGTTNCEGPATAVTLTIREALSFTSVTGPTAVCSQSTGQIYSPMPATPPTKPFGGATQYLWPTTGTGDWTLTNPPTSNTANYTIGTSSGAKTLTTTLQYTDGTCSTTNSLALTVNPLPGAKINADSSNLPVSTASYCSSGTVKVRLSNITGIGSGNFTVSYTDNLNTAYTPLTVPLTGGSFTPSSQPASGSITTYTITQIVDNATNGCTSTKVLNPTLLINNCKVYKKEALNPPGLINGTSPVCATDVNLPYTTSSTQFPSTTVGGKTRFRWQITTANGWTFASTNPDTVNSTMEFNSGTGSGTFQASIEYKTSITPSNSNNFCPSTASTAKTVNVVQRAIASISTTTASICKNTKPSLTFTITGIVSPFNVTVVYKDAANNPYTISNITTSPYTFIHANALTASDNFTLSSIVSNTAPNCTGTIGSPASVAITVYDLPVAAIVGTATICSGNSTPLTVTITGSGSGVLSGPYSAVISDGSSTYNFNNFNSGDQYFVSPTTTKTYSLVSVQRSSAPTCAGTVNPATVLITVNQPPTTSNAGRDTAFCFPKTSYTLLGNTPVIPSTGSWSLVSGPAGSTITAPSNPASNFSITPGNWGNYVLRWTIINGTCTPSMDDVIISFGNSPTISNAGSNTSSCFPNYTLAGNTPTTGIGTWSKVAGLGTANFSNVNSPTSPVKVSLPGLYTFRWTISSGSCTPSTSDVNITFDPLPTSNAGSDLEICSNQTNVTITGTPTNNSLLQWVEVGLTDGTIVSGGNSNILTYKPGTHDISSGKATLAFLANGLLTCGTTVAKDTMILNLDALPVISAGSSTNICGTSTTLAGTKTIGSGTWSKFSGPGTVTFGNANLGNSTVSISAYGSYRLVWTVTNSLCLVTDTLNIAFYENPSTSSPGANKSSCTLSTILGGTAFAYTSAQIGIRTRTWAKVSGPGTLSFDDATSPTATVTATAYGAYVLSWTEVNGPCIKTSNVTVSFNQPPSVNITPATPASVCQGTSLQLNGNPAQGTGTSFTSHAWTGNTGILSSTTIQNPLVQNTTAFGNYNLTYTVTDNNTCTASGNIAVTVNALAVITSQPVNDTVCENSPAFFSVGATGTSLVYQWQVNTGSGFTNLSNDATYSGVTNSTLNIVSAASNFNSYQFRCVLTTFSSCPKFSNTATLKVNSLANIIAQPTNMMVCEGGSASSNINAAGTGLVYKWQENRGTGWNNLIDGGVYSGTSSSTLNLTSLQVTMNGYRYRCVLNTTGSCPKTSNEDTLTVHANPAISVQPANVEVCQNNKDTIIISASGPGIVFQWQIKNGGSFINLTDNSTYTGSTTNALQISNADLSIDNSIYRCKLITTGSCQLISNSALLDVTPVALVNAGSPGEVCSNMSTYTIQATGGASASNYSTITWTSSSGGTFVNPNTTLATYNINATDRTNHSVTLTLKAHANGSCPDNQSTMTLSVTSAPLANAGSDQETCENTVFDLNNSTIQPTASNYNNLLWSKTGTGSLSQVNILKPTYNPSLGETGDITLTLQAFGNGSCALAQDFMVLHITPKPSANAGTDEATCTGVPFDLSTSISKPTASEYSSLKWTHNGAGSWKNGIDNVLLPTYIPGIGDNGKTITLTLTAYGNDSCKHRQLLL